MKIVWAPEAIDDLAALRAYISQDNPPAAQRLALHILDTVETVLAENPHIGRPGRVPGTREFVIDKSPYIIPYRVKDNALQILRVYHGARRWPDTL
ncbi:MAG: type II toxin-antitoxin system RelE/ParE family toxin [Methylocystis sp.]